MTHNLRDPFNPKTGKFAKNIRSITGGDDSELRESMKTYGWHNDFPAIVDENDVVLVGHRRLRLAKQLDIKPVIKKLTLGKGDEADAERLKLAIISNIGFKPMTKDDRKRIAEYLYGKREWTMEAIAKALNVHTSTIGEDLKEFSPRGKNTPKGRGRPKGSRKRSGPQPERRKNDPAKEDAAASLVLDQKKTYEQAATAVGLKSVQVVKTAVAREEGRREERAKTSSPIADLNERRVLTMIDDNSICALIAKWGKGKSEQVRGKKAWRLVYSLLGEGRSIRNDLSKFITESRFGGAFADEQWAVYDEDHPGEKIAFDLNLKGKEK
jgi:ParB-like chromosome segregation protein Spo0J